MADAFHCFIVMDVRAFFSAFLFLSYCLLCRHTAIVIWVKINQS